MFNLGMTSLWFLTLWKSLFSRPQHHCLVSINYSTKPGSPSCLQQSLLGSSKHHHLTCPFIFNMLTCTVIGYKWMSVPSEWLKEKISFSGRWPTHPNFICQTDPRPLQAVWLNLWLVHHWHNPSITGSWLKPLMDRNKMKNINMALVN